MKKMMYREFRFGKYQMGLSLWDSLHWGYIKSKRPACVVFSLGFIGVWIQME